MKTIGLLGGMSWESTMTYYQLLNQGVRQRSGGLHSARILLHSVDFAQIEDYQRQGQWQEAGNLLATAASGLERIGADVILICTNLMHKVAPAVAAQIRVPLLHIADATGRAIKDQQLTKVGLLGTRYTMEESFYRQRLQDRYALDLLIPAKPERESIHRIIYQELCHGQFTAAARQTYLAIIENLRDQGAQGIILGCTEIPLLIRQSDTDLPLFDTTALHAQAALAFAFGDATVSG